MHLVDGRDAFQSNWLRYVNCSRSTADQNIRAVQYDGNIYYMATKQIEIGDELLAFYGEKFAKILGIKTPKKGASKEKDKGNNLGAPSDCINNVVFVILPSAAVAFPI